MPTTPLGGVLPNGEGEAGKVATYNEYLINVLEPRAGWVGELVSAEVSITAADTLDSTAFGKMHVITGTSADYTITLFTPTTPDLGKVIGFRVSNAGTKLYTLDAAGAETIDGLSDIKLVKNDVVYLKAVATTGNTWQTVGRNIGAPISWTPTLTNLTIGDGTLVASYIKIGKRYFCRVSVIFGSTTSVAGAILFTLPATSIAYPGAVGLTAFGQARALDLDLGVAYEGGVYNPSTTQGAIRFLDSSGAYVVQVQTGTNVPFTWATGDEIVAVFDFEGA